MWQQRLSAVDRGGGQVAGRGASCWPDGTAAGMKGAGWRVCPREEEMRCARRAACGCRGVEGRGRCRCVGGGLNVGGGRQRSEQGWRLRKGKGSGLPWYEEGDSARFDGEEGRLRVIAARAAACCAGAARAERRGGGQVGGTRLGTGEGGDGTEPAGQAEEQRWGTCRWMGVRSSWRRRAANVEEQAKVAVVGRSVAWWGIARGFWDWKRGGWVRWES